MNIPSFALQLQFEPDTGRWFIQMDDDVRVWFDSFEEGIQALSRMMGDSRNRDELNESAWLQR